MPQTIAAIVFAFGISGLFMLDRDRMSRTSKALWIPVVWLLISSSRSVSAWLQPDSPLTTPDQYLEGSPTDRFVFACLLVAGLVVLFNRRQVGSFLQANKPILLFFIFCGVSVLWSDYPDVAFKRWTKALGDLVMVLIVLTDAQPAAAVKRLVARAGFLLLPTSVLFIRYYPNLGRGYDPWTGMPSLFGVTTNKNSLGLVALIFGVGAAWRFLEEFGSKGRPNRLKHLLAQGILLTISLWLLIKAHSATSLVCFLLASTVLAITSLLVIGRKQAVVHLLVLGSVFTPPFVLFASSGSAALEALGRDSTLTGRTGIWNLVLGMAQHPIFGAGFESFWLGDRVRKASETFFYQLNEAHNGYIEVYLNLGWIGVTLLLLCFVTGYRNALGEFRRDPGLGRLRLALIIVAAVYSLTEAGFRMLSPVWIFFLLATSAVPKALAQESPAPLRVEDVNHLDDLVPENMPTPSSTRRVPSFR